MNFYDEIAHKLYVWNTKIDETEFEPFDFIEAMHNKATHKGKVFYQNLIKAMPKHFGAKMRSDFFNDVLNYCKHKIDQIIDERFFLNTFFEEQEQIKSPYIGFKSFIEANGFFSIANVKIYTPEMVVILTSKELPAQNMETQTDTTINGLNYLKTFIEAFKEGEQYFETEFMVSPNTLYGANAEHYVRDIHMNFFHTQHTVMNAGWSYIKRKSPFILTHKIVREHGYYSGIVSKVEEQVKKYPKLFTTFDKCEHKIETQQTETETEQETENDFTLSTIEDWLFEFKEKMSETDYQNLVSALVQYFETGKFSKLSKPIQINGRPNKKLFGWALNRIFEAMGKGVEKELLQFAKQNISLFTDVQFDEKNILKSNLYKYFTTKTK